MIELIHQVSDEECVHEFPDDWQFGGANGTDPRGDVRWVPTSYIYYDDKLRVVHLTQVPICDDEAIDYFTQVANYGPEFNPCFLHAKRPDGSVEPIAGRYDKTTDTFWED